MMNKRQGPSSLLEFSWPAVTIALALLVIVVCGILAVHRYSSHAAGRGYALHNDITATVFWIGEPADDSNGNVSNAPTAWDDDAKQRFGGNDGPTGKNGDATDIARNSSGIVTGFRPLQNPFYFALPAAEFSDNGLITKARQASPWHDQSVGDDRSLFKGRWIEVNSGSHTIYAQWLDVGPNIDEDYGYVFGDGKQKPKNSFGLKAGLDLSPAAAISLGFSDGSRQVSWQFVDPQNVPDGPWKQYPAIDNKTYWN